MKVLWLVSITIPAAADACGLQAKEIGGGWLSGALGGMTAAPDAPAITVASVDARAETLTVCSKNGVSFALVPTGSVENFSALLKKIAPDLVHIWGTEYPEAAAMQDAAAALRYSDAYFCKLFKQCFKVNFSAYLNEYRVNKARQLILDPRLSLKDIGAAVGYSDANYFTRVFKRLTGQTPSEYRVAAAEKAAQG